MLKMIFAKTELIRIQQKPESLPEQQSNEYVSDRTTYNIQFSKNLVLTAKSGTAAIMTDCLLFNLRNQQR
jgi:hypothetical protein